MEDMENGKNTEHCALGMIALLHMRAHRSCGYRRKIVLTKNSSMEEEGASEAVAEEQFMTDGERESVTFLWGRVAFGRVVHAPADDPARQMGSTSVAQGTERQLKLEKEVWVWVPSWKELDRKSSGGYDQDTLYFKNK